MTQHPNQALNAYRQVGLAGHVASGETSPHTVIQLLMDGALDRISTARSAMAHRDLMRKAQVIPEAIRIIDGLRIHLDHERGGELAGNLAALYDYMSRRLIDANMNDDPQALDEVSGLLGEIKAGWDAIAPAAADGQGL
ncbi:MAG: flagellar export chaperone FliS [Gammaproteobacteria bacterium]|jgi:flagellar protein FliS